VIAGAALATVSTILFFHIFHVGTPLELAATHGWFLSPANSPKS